TPQHYTCSLHDALPIWKADVVCGVEVNVDPKDVFPRSAGKWNRRPTRTISSLSGWESNEPIGNASRHQVARDGNMEVRRRRVDRSEEHTSELQSWSHLV